MQKVLVLNFDYSPLNVTSLQRGFILVDSGKAEIIKSADNPIVTLLGSTRAKKITEQKYNN